MVKLFSLKSPDEWVTTKQACRDTYVVTCFLPSTIRITRDMCFPGEGTHITRDKRFELEICKTVLNT